MSGGEVIIENPPDYADLNALWASDPRSGNRLEKRHCPLWHLSWVKSFAALTGAKYLHFAQCQLGSDFQKYTTLLVTPRWLERASALLQAFGDESLTFHPSPFTRFTLHPSPFTLHPSPVTRHPSPFTRFTLQALTLHPSPSTSTSTSPRRHLATRVWAGHACAGSGTRVVLPAAMRRATISPQTLQPTRPR